MATNYRTIGESGENLYDPIYIKQPDDHSCALRCQQIVLRDFGIDIPFEDLEKYALEAGIYSEDGTYTCDIGKALVMAGVNMHQVTGSTIIDLTNELAQGHRVIVSVDADELWYNDTLKGKLTNWMNDVIGRQGGNHALIVAGIEVNPSNTNDVKVVLTDTGAGHLRIEYPLDQFMDAWKDSNCFMAATDDAAPYQYDAATGMEVPSNFFVEHSYNQFVLEHGYQLNPDVINIQADYHPIFVGISSIDDFLSQLNIKNGNVSSGCVGNLFTEHSYEDYLHTHDTDGQIGNLCDFTFEEQSDDGYHPFFDSESMVGLGSSSDNSLLLADEHLIDETQLMDEA